MNTKMKSVFTVLIAAFFLAPSMVHAAVDQAKLLAEKKAELNGHEWQVKLVPAADPKKGSPKEDTLIFKDLKFESKGNSSKGFNSTNYTITLQEGGPSVWETMQSDGKGATVNWRGEWEGDSMHGVMSHQSNGKSEDFYFNSLSKSAVVEAPKVEEPAPATVPEIAPEGEAPAADAAVESAPVEAAQVEAAAPAPEKTQPVEEKKDKKKKKWF